jgi:hypothetical protein
VSDLLAGVAELAPLVAAGFAAWMVSTVAGGGGASLVVPLVAAAAGARAVAPIVTLGTMLVNPTRVLLFRSSIRWDIVRWYLPGAIVGGGLGAWTLAQVRAEWMAIVLGVFLLTMAALQARPPAKKAPSRHPRIFLPAGVGVAFVSGLVGAGGPLLNPFYLGVGALKEEMIGTKSFNAFFLHLTKIGSYVAVGLFSAEHLRYGIALGVGASLGSWAAKPLLARMPARVFRVLVVAGMAVAGTVMIWQQRAMLQGG